MNADEVRAKVLEIVRIRAEHPETVGDSTLLGIDLGLDYLDKLELVIDIEEELGITIEDEEVELIKNVGDLVREAQNHYEDQKILGKGLRITDTVEDKDLVK